MSVDYLYYSTAYLGVILVLNFLLRRYTKKKVYKNVRLSAMMFVAFAWLVYILNLTVHSPFDDVNSTVQKFSWLVLSVIFSYAAVTLFFWILYEFVIREIWPELPRLIFKIVGLIIMIILFLVAIHTIFKVELTGILVGSTVISAIIGLALQDTLGNLIAGISLNIEAPFNIGDWVNLGGHEGKIVTQNWRTLTIRTRNSHRVSLTNKFIAEDKIINFSKPSRRQIHNFYIFLDYGHPPNVVKGVLNNLLQEIPEVDIKPDLGTFVVDYGDSGIKYCLRYWLYDYADILAIQDKVLTRIWYTLKRNKIDIPYPISDLRMSVISSDESSRKRQEIAHISSSLSSLEWLNALSETQIENLAENARIVPYANGAYIVKQGEDGDSMFVIVAGQVDIKIHGSNKNELNVSKRGKGDFFGEMSLLTGEPRSASVVADGDVTVIVINKASFTEVLMSDPAILELMMDGMESQRSDLEEIIKDDKNRSSGRSKKIRAQLLEKIFSYFGLK